MTDAARNEPARPVWLTRDQRDWLEFFTSGSDIVVAWDAAPADPVEAVRVLVEMLAAMREPYESVDETVRAIFSVLGRAP